MAPRDVEVPVGVEADVGRRVASDGGETLSDALDLSGTGPVEMAELGVVRGFAQWRSRK
jgi:hypothetical protein